MKTAKQQYEQQRRRTEPDLGAPWRTQRPTLTSADNLAMSLHAAREHQGARELDEDTLARRRRVLGDDHPETMGSAAFDLIPRGLAIGGEPEWMAALREAHKRPGS